MPKFTYTAKDGIGKTITGSIDVKDRSILAQVLREKGMILITSKIEGNSDQNVDLEKKKFNFNISFGGFLGVPMMEKVLFSRHLSVMISAGTPITKALDTLAKQTANTQFKYIISKVVIDVQKGVGLADSFAKYPKVFSDFFVNMIRVGETTGKLDEVLILLSDQMKKERDLISKVRGAMLYPAVILTAMIGIAILMMIFVLPNLTRLFEDMNVELPATTQTVLNLSKFMQQHVAATFGIIFTAIFIVVMFIKTKRGKIVLGWLFLKMPIFKGMTQKVNAARFSRVLSSLIDAGVPIVQSLKITSTVLSNHYYKLSLANMAEEIQKGASLQSLLTNYPHLYPGLVAQMAEVGEETGTLSTVLKRLSSFYEDEVNEFTKNISSIIEPVLMLIIGAAVGFFAVSMIQPMYSIMSTV